MPERVIFAKSFATTPAAATAARPHIIHRHARFLLMPPPAAG